jgi:4-hydroxythreonine-4-phosphate dehydrogenase
MRAERATTSVRPTIAVAMGDPAGISPELLARLLDQKDITDTADIVIFGDRRILDIGATIAGTGLAIDVIADMDAVPEKPRRPVLVDLKNLDPADVTVGAATLAGGTFATDNFRRALRYAQAGRAQGVVFTPFNKKAMRLAYPNYDDEIRFIADVLDLDCPAREFNVLDKLWNARVSSHIPLSEVAAAVTADAILRNLALADACMRSAGFETPRIAVAALNPHGGDGGNFGREEIDIIAPAVEEAVRRGYPAQGPFPADTVFLRAQRGDFDAVLTMYHDQGQIAMKLMGFDRGVTLVGGFPFPICTPAHGTAYDIAGRGIANPGATRQAMLLAIRMASQNLAKADAAAAAPTH